MKLLKTAAAVGLLAMASVAQADLKPLVDVGDGTVYDPNQHLIWLKDWNVNGENDWTTQHSWAEGLTFAGSSDWHLPEVAQYKALTQQFGSIDKVPEFNNASFRYYWSGTEHVTNQEALGWLFLVLDGKEHEGNKYGEAFAVAVRPGDVAAAVPEPETYALLLAGLSVVAGVARRRSKQQ